MRYTVNLYERKCPKIECECKSCPFNGIEGMCIGCTECIEHKLLAPVSSCSITKKGSWSGFCAVMLNDLYFISVPMGICDIPEYFYISKEEFESFNDWKEDTAKIIEIQNRKMI